MLQPTGSASGSTDPCSRCDDSAGTEDSEASLQAAGAAAWCLFFGSSNNITVQSPEVCPLRLFHQVQTNEPSKQALPCSTQLEEWTNQRRATPSNHAADAQGTTENMDSSSPRLALPWSVTGSSRTSARRRLITSGRYQHPIRITCPHRRLLQVRPGGEAVTTGCAGGLASPQRRQTGGPTNRAVSVSWGCVLPVPDSPVQRRT